MDLDLSAEQAALIELFESIAVRFSTPDVVRASEALGFAPELWQQLVAAGAPGMTANEEHGGGGASLLDLALVVETLGRRLAPVPLVEHTVATSLWSAVDAPPADVVSGAQIATIALRPVIDGIARLVPAGAVARFVLALDDNRLVLVDSEPPGAAVPNLAGAPLAHRAVDGARVLRAGADARSIHERALAEWRALTAGALVGLGIGALDEGTAYVKERAQFGRPIGSFQAIQHTLADISVALDGAQLLARKGAWAHDEGLDDAPWLSAMAFLFAAETAQRASERALHFHGGYGFMQEYDVQLYYRRAKGWPLQLDSIPREYARLAARRYGELERAG